MAQPLEFLEEHIPTMNSEEVPTSAQFDCPSCSHGKRKSLCISALKVEQRTVLMSSLILDGLVGHFEAQRLQCRARLLNQRQVFAPLLDHVHSVALHEMLSGHRQPLASSMWSCSSGRRNLKRQVCK
eukprot:5525879-Amphidinium_carterae.1